MIATLPLEGLDRHTLVEKMAGRSIVEFFPRHASGRKNDPEQGLAVKEFKSSKMTRPVSFEVKKGEIYGITGLEGCGATDLARGLFGVDRRQQGQVMVDGRNIQIQSPRGALLAGFGFVTKDRRKEGLILMSSLDENMAIPLRIRRNDHGWLNVADEKSKVRSMVEKLDIRTSDLSTESQFLSGGNQQKVILAKWLLTECRVLIVDEPTRGVDVESKAEIYKLLRELVDQGVIVVVVSSDMEEVLGLCDRILVLHRGEIEAELPYDLADERAVMLAATGCRLDAQGRPLDAIQEACEI